VVCITASFSGSRDFTLEKYRELCQVLLDHYCITTVSDYLTQKPAGNTAILRHDVDRKIRNALRMAELENAMGIRSTYYFRYPYTFNPEIIRKIRNLGHETGYHYEVLSKAKGDYSKAIALFERELAEFRTICQVDTICMHGQPLSPIHNLDIWKQYDYRTFGLKGEAYLSISGAVYFTDTGRNWSGRNNISDFIDARRAVKKTETTDDLISTIQNNNPQVVYLTTHPERWSYSTGSHLINYGTDLIFNAGKLFIRTVRHAKSYLLR